MKVIDVLNKIANSEEVPKHIFVNNEDWYWNNYDGYVTKNSLKTTPDAQTYLFKKYRIDFMLNTEIEIIEEPKEELEEIELLRDSVHFLGVNLKVNEIIFKDKINELIANQNKIIRELKANKEQ